MHVRNFVPVLLLLACGPSACGSSSSSTSCFVPFRFHKLSQDLANSGPAGDVVNEVSYTGIVDGSCGQFLGQNSGPYSLKLVIDTKAVSAYVKAIDFGENRTLTWNRLDRDLIELNGGKVVYKKSLSQTEQLDRPLLLPWYPAPETFELILAYALKPGLDNLPNSINLQFSIP